MVMDRDPPENPSNSGGSEARNYMLLSALLKQNNGFIPELQLNNYAKHAMRLQQKTDKSVEDNAFILDYMEHILKAKISDSMVERRVTDRSEARIGKNPDAQAIAIPFAPNIRLNELVIKPEQFDGKKPSPQRWMEDYERAAQANGWVDAAMVKYLPTFLVRAAYDWYVTMAQPRLSVNAPWTELRALFVRHYLGESDKIATRRAIQQTFQGAAESVATFMPRLLLLLLLAEPNMSELEKVERVREKLRSQYHDHLCMKQPANLDELNEICLSIESGFQARRAAEEREKQSRPRDNQRFTPKPNDSQMKRDDKKPHKKPPTDHGQERKCNRCDRNGHETSKCFSKTKLDGSKLAPITQKPVGSIINNTNAEPKISPKIATINHVCAAVPSLSGFVTGGGELISQPIKLNGVLQNALVDTGSFYTLISEGNATNNGWVPEGNSPNLVGADSNPLRCLGKITVTLGLTLGKRTKEVAVKLIVLRGLCTPLILGLQVLRWLKVTINTAQKQLKFDDPIKKGLYIKNDTIISPRTQLVIEAAVDAVGLIQVTPFNFGSGILVANSISYTTDGLSDCMVANLESNPILLKAGTQIAGIELIASEGLKSLQEDRVNAVIQIDEDETVKIGSQLNEQQIEDLAKLLQRYKEAFSIRGSIGKTKTLEHCIELLDGSKPFAEPLRRRPLAHKEETKKQITQMLAQGIIENSNSPWASAYVLAKKKSGEMRLCIDFRKLNDMTKKCSYPLPHIDDCIETLSGKRFFTQLDLASGFWQIPLEEKSKEYTAFRTEDGHYQFRRMPFGLCNAPASFQRMINAVFAGLKGLDLQVFIDDLCIASNTWHEHLDTLEKVFQLLISANLKLKGNKCLFAAKTVIFLGHELSEDGIRQDPEKLKAMLQLPIPNNASDVRRALGMFSYYRKFVPNFAMIVEPLTRLTRKNVTFQWSHEQAKAFETILKELHRNATLSHYNYEDPVALKTDASGQGVAGILLQKKDGDWRLVCCASRRLNSSEQNYGVTDLEGLAVVYSITKFRHFLLGRKFSVLTDHCALCALRKGMPNSARLRRWAIILSEYDFDITYVKGGLHRDVDCLSRAPVDNREDDLLDAKVFSVPLKNHKEQVCPAISIPVDKDDWLDSINNDGEAAKYLEKAARNEDKWLTIDSILYHDFRMYIPNEKRATALRNAHEESTACHGGIAATLDKLKSVYWPGLQEDVKHYIKSCVLCQKRKSERQLPAGNEMRSHEAYKPLELVSVDVLGPLTTTATNSKYIIAAYDVFTKFIYAEDVKNIQATTFCRFISSYMSRFGAPATLLTDNSTTFVNQLTRQICSSYGVTHKTATPYHHQGNAPVERSLQSLQEKLSLLINDQENDSNWDTVLPKAVFSLNATQSKSTGFTPFRLMFGDREFFRSNLLQRRETPEDAHVNRLDQQQSVDRTSAVASLSKARVASRPYFENKRLARSYEPNELVLVREPERRSKLSLRYRGPYKVIRSRNDIYSLKSEDTGEELERHIADLKPFLTRTTLTMRSHAFLVLLLVTNWASTSGLNGPLNRVPPVMWKQSKKYVSRGITEFAMEVHYANPCSVLNQWNIPGHEMTTAFQSCSNLFEQQITNRIISINWKPKERKQPIVPQPQIYNTNNVPLVHVVPRPNKVPPPVTPRHQRELHEVSEKDSKMEYPINNEIHVSNINSTTFSSDKPLEVMWRKKRGLTDFVTGAFASNVLQTVLDRWFPNQFETELARQQHYLEQRASVMAQQLNLTHLVQQATNEAVSINAEAIQHNLDRIDAITALHPELMLVTSLIVFKIQMIGIQLDKVKLSFRQRKPDVLTLAQLLDTNLLDNLDSESVIHQASEVSSPAPNVARFFFVARNRSPEASVYEVNAFKFWSDIEQPFSSKLLEYVGPKFLIYNHTNNCVKSIAGQPQNDYVTAYCTENDYEDAQLTRWKVVSIGDPYAQPAQVQVAESWPDAYAYCFTLNITYDGKTFECPPHAFSLNATHSWSTSDGYVYSPSAIEILAAEKQDPVTTIISSVHLRNVSHLVNENSVILKLRDTWQQLETVKLNNVAMKVPGMGDVTYKNTTHTLLCLIALSIFGTIGACYYVANTSRRRHHNLMRTVTDSTHGEGYYDTVVRQPSAQSSRSASINRKRDRNIPLPPVPSQHPVININMKPRVEPIPLEPIP